jgi:aspartyl-tRNA(Asn)/glutamyl-tRNA(Gln) amidotransferase subunit B
MSGLLPDDWEMVVGLEVHTELATATKLFCGCANAFGGEPNTNVCPSCLGLPGSLPVLNEYAVELAIRIGLALHCKISPSTFARKNYFYPDQPKDYQISQYDQPINGIGHLDLPDGSRVMIERAHMEEDTGKTTHLGGSGRIHGSDESIVDYNRAGVPLVEIVSGPDIRSAEQARAYAAELRGILIATGASDGRMEEGSMRVDANVSVRRGPDAPFGTRCEIKNLNSLRSVQRAIDHEALRQIALLEVGESIVQETRHWDEDAGRTQTLRSKEEAYDYRYFPEPDLVPLVPSAEQIEAIGSTLPPMPAERRRTLVDLLGGSPTDAQSDQLLSVVDQGLDQFVVAATEGGIAASLALARVANELAGLIDTDGTLPEADLVALLALEEAGELSPTQTKAVMADLVAAGGGDPRAAAKARGFEQMESGALDAILDEIVAAHPDEWQRYAEGDDKLAGFFTGKVMAATKGQADGKAVNAGLRQRRG